MEVEKGEIITLSDNREYVCLGIIMDENNKKYLYLMTTSKPVEFCFVEETIINSIIQMRVVGSRDEKYKLFGLLKTQLQTNHNQGVKHV